MFKFPFRANTYKFHHENYHQNKWSEYDQASNAEKKTFFDGVVKLSSTILAHIEGEGDLHLIFNHNIVQDIIGDLLFDLDDVSTQSTSERALELFKPYADVEQAIDDNEEQNLNRDAFIVKITYLRMFRKDVGFISRGSSFRSAAIFAAVAKDIKKASYLRGSTEGISASFTRVVFAASSQGVNEMLSDRWVLSIALYVGHSQATSYIYLRIRFCKRAGSLSNHHVLEI